MTNWIITSSVLILIFVAARRLLKGHISPLLQYGLWLIVLARLIVPVNSIQSPISILNAIPAVPAAVVSETIDTTETTETTSAFPAAVTPTPYTEVNISDAPEITTSAPAQSSLPSLSFVLGTLWLTGMAGILIYAAIRNARLARFLHRTRRPFADGVYVAPALPSSCLFGVIRPTVYITEAVAADPQALQHVLAHEQAHRRHGDYIWNLLRIGVLALHWYNPLVWWACALSKRDAEMAADTSAIATLAPEERFSYGETLLNMLDCAAARDTWFSCSTTMITTKRALRERIEAIVKNAHTALSMAALVLLMTIAVVGCTFTGAEDDMDSKVDSGTAETTPYIAPNTPYGAERIETITRWLKEDYGYTYEDISETLLEWINDFEILDASCITDYYLQKMSDGSMLGYIYYEEDPPNYEVQKQIDQLVAKAATTLGLEYFCFDGDGAAQFVLCKSREGKYREYFYEYNLRIQSEQDPRVFDPSYTEPFLAYYNRKAPYTTQLAESMIQWACEDYRLTYEDYTSTFLQWNHDFGEVNTELIEDCYIIKMSDGSIIGSFVYPSNISYTPTPNNIKLFAEAYNMRSIFFSSQSATNDAIFCLIPNGDSLEDDALFQKILDNCPFHQYWMLGMSINWADRNGLYD